MVVLRALRLVARPCVPLLRYATEEEDAPCLTLGSWVHVLVDTTEVLPEPFARKCVRLLVGGVRCADVDPMDVLPARVLGISNVPLPA